MHDPMLSFLSSSANILCVKENLRHFLEIAIKDIVLFLEYVFFLKWVWVQKVKYIYRVTRFRLFPLFLFFIRKIRCELFRVLHLNVQMLARFRVLCALRHRVLRKWEAFRFVKMQPVKHQGALAVFFLNPFLDVKTTVLATLLRPPSIPLFLYLESRWPALSRLVKSSATACSLIH